jgi:hypothetical protein
MAQAVELLLSESETQPYPKKKKRAGGVAQELDSLPSKH